MRRALDRLAGLHGHITEAAALFQLTITYLHLGHVGRARECGDRMVRLGAESHAQSMEVTASVLMVEVDRLTGAPERALTLARQLLEFKRESSAPHLMLVVLSAIGVIEDHFGDHAAAVTTLNEGLRIAREQGRDYHVVWLLLDLARASYAAGDHEGAVECAVEALELSRERHFRVFEGRALTTLSLLRKEPDLAAEAFTLQRETGHLLCQAEALFLLGRADEAGEIVARYTGDPSFVPPGTIGPGTAGLPG